MSVVMFFMPTGQQATGTDGTDTRSLFYSLQLTASRRSTVEGHPRLWPIAQGRAEAVPGPCQLVNNSIRAREATAMLRDADLGHDAQAMCRFDGICCRDRWVSHLEVNRL